jgi:hypothetical protein
MAAPIKHLFKDAVQKSVPMKGSGRYEGAEQLPEGLPGRSGGMIPEKSYDDIAGKVKPGRNPGESMWLLKGRK